MAEKQSSGKKKRAVRHVIITTVIMLLAILMTVAISAVSYRIFSDSTRDLKTQTAGGMAKLTADFVDGDLVDGWLAGGKDERYAETEKRLARILYDTPDVEYVYVYQIREDGCHVVFDFDTDGVAADDFGELIEFDPTFLPYIDTLLSGGHIEPIESNDQFGWLLTVYEPICDSNGRCVAYAGADVSMDIIKEITTSFITAVTSISSLFLAAFIAIAMWIFSSARRADEMDVLLEQQDRDKKLLREIMESFATVIDLKDSYTQGHSKRVANYTAMLTRELGYDEKTVEEYYNVALLHDIGKIGIPDEVLNKPGKLTEEEFKIIKSHAWRGHEALKEIELMPEAATGAGCHHERPDGLGYPRGLKGGEIPRVAQIIAVADTFDAMYSDRPYRKRMNFDKAVSIIREVNGTQLATDVVEAFLRLVAKGEFRAEDDVGGGSMEDISNIRNREE